LVRQQADDRLRRAEEERHRKAEEIRRRQEIVPHVPPVLEGKNEYVLANKLFAEGDYVKAVEHVKNARSLKGTTNTDIEYLLTKSFYQMHDYDTSLIALEAYFQLSPKAVSGSQQYTEMVELRSTIEQARKKYQDVLKEVENSMVHVPAGCYSMGDTFEDEDEMTNEKPVHEVCVKAFLLGKYEVTQTIYQTVMGKNPSKFAKGGNIPVESVSWDDVQAFIGRLNEYTGKKLPPAHRGRVGVCGAERW
jgi:formylglycine-generating enzyme required for sulfatase activity